MIEMVRGFAHRRLLGGELNGKSSASTLDQEERWFQVRVKPKPSQTALSGIPNILVAALFIFAPLRFLYVLLLVQRRDDLLGGGFRPISGRFLAGVSGRVPVTFLDPDFCEALCSRFLLVFWYQISGQSVRSSALLRHRGKQVSEVRSASRLRHRTHAGAVRFGFGLGPVMADPYAVVRLTMCCRRLLK